MSTGLVAQFFRDQDVSLLLDPTFVLELESQMLFPGVQQSELCPTYATFLGLKAGRETLPPPLIPPPSTAQRAPASMGGKPSRTPATAPINPNSLYWPDEDSGWWGERGRQKDAVSLRPRPRIIHVDLQEVNVLRPYRVALDLAKSMEDQVTRNVRQRTADGVISAISLDIFRLLSSKTFKTKKGRAAQPSMGLVAFVSQRYNLGRPQRGRGRTRKDSDAYPSLVENVVREIWRQYEECSALWAAFRALSPLAFYTPPSGHLLSGLDADEFLRLALAFEQGRQELRRNTWASTPPSALGPEAAFEELRRVLDKHVPTYFVHK